MAIRLTDMIAAAMAQHNVLDPALSGGVGTSPAQPSPGPGMPYYGYAQHPNAAPSPPREGTYAPPPPPTSLQHQQPPPQQQQQPQEFGSVQQAPAPPGEELKRPRACEACRGLKVKCDQPEDRPDLPCKRCAKAGRPCQITQPTRKRQKKSDSRVAELEKRLEELTSAVQAQANGRPMVYQSPPDQSSPHATLDPSISRQSIGSQQAYGTPSSYQMTPQDGGNPLKRRRTEDSPFSGQQPRMQRPPGAPDMSTRYQASNETDKDSIEHSWGIANDVTRFLHHVTPTEFMQRINALVSPEQGAVLFERYNTQLAPHLPAVVFPAGTTVDQVYREKPLLYLAVIGAASHGQIEPEITRELIREAIGAFADCAVRNGAKSLEVVQAMQITALWYKPPERTEQTNFYQIIHIAATMALDLGLNMRFNPAKARRGLFGPAKDAMPNTGIKMGPVNSDTAEAKRAWLACYYLCASASMVLRRPNLIEWTNYMQECVDDLEKREDAAPTDKLFLQHVKLQHICEKVGKMFHMHDPSANVNLDDAQVAYNVNTLEVELGVWKREIPVDCKTAGLDFFEHVCSLYAHEIVLHHNHNVDDFKMPFNEESLKNVNAGSGTLTQNQITALKACVKAAHGILDTMLSFDQETITALPMLLYFVRCVYAVVILIKMHVAVSIQNSELGKLFHPESLKVEHYLNGLIEHFGAKRFSHGQIRPDKVLRILGVLRDWFEEKHKKGIVAANQPRGTDQGPDTKQRKQGKNDQSGLHMLSSLAANQQPTAQPQNPADFSTDWTFDRAHPMPYQPRYSTNPHANAANAEAAAQANQHYDYYNQLLESEFGWDLGVQQAMDIALGDMNGLGGNGLDNYLLGGDNMAPFGGYDQSMGAGAGAGGAGGMALTEGNLAQHTAALSGPIVEMAWRFFDHGRKHEWVGEEIVFAGEKERLFDAWLEDQEKVRAGDLRRQ